MISPRLTPREKRILKVIKDSNLDAREIRILLHDHLEARSPPRIKKVRDHLKKNYRIGIISDTHIGHEMFDEGLFEWAGEMFRKNKVEKVYHCGDILAGMAKKELSHMAHLGYQNQIEEAGRLFSTYFKGLEIRGINGERDLEYAKARKGSEPRNVSDTLAGILRGENLQYISLGDLEANISLLPDITLRIIHAQGGKAYADSYKLEKLIESFGGGSKPTIVAQGHYQKALYMVLRDVWGFEVGSLCGQTTHMRQKQDAVQKGFWILEIKRKNEKFDGINPTFIPGYKQ